MGTRRPNAIAVTHELACGYDADAMSTINAEMYRDAALEHVTATEGLYASGRHALTHYVSGLAVECMLRAYRVRVEPTFDSRHDLRLLLDASGFEALVPQRHQEQFSESLSVVALQWNNAHRFRSESGVRGYLKQLKLDRGIKGDFLKERSRRIRDAAIYIVTLGDNRWT